MTVGIRNYPSQDRNAANALPYFNNFAMMPGQSAAGKSQYGNQFIDEQTVPQALYQPKIDSYKDMQQDFQNIDPLSYNQWYNSQSQYPYNSAFMAYPVFQPSYNDSSAVQGNEHATLRQNSIPHGSLDQFLDNSGFDYEQVLQNLDLTQYENPEQFCLEDYADLEQVNDGVNFDVKQEKDDSTDGKNLEEMETVLNNNILNTNNPMVNYTNGVTTETPVSINTGDINTVNITNDQTLDEQNLLEILEFYSSPNSVEWQPPSNYLPTTNQVVTASGETIVKTEPNDRSSISCDFALQPISPLSNADEGMPTIGVPDQELIQMPVSRFNELLVSLTPEQSNLAKDIRRRGKNKQAARLCRKRKLDNISSLEETLTDMQEEKSRLLSERKEIVAETEELKSSIEMICGMLMKGLTEQNIGLADLSVLHHSNGQTLLVQK